MKTSELIKYLQKSIESSGDLDVVVYTDHGQTQSEAQATSIQTRVLDECEIDGDIVLEIYGE